MEEEARDVVAIDRQAGRRAKKKNAIDEMLGYVDYNNMMSTLGSWSHSPLL